MPTTSPIFSGTITQSTIQTMAVQATGDWIGVLLSVTNMSGDQAAATFYIQWSVDGGTWANSTPPDTFEPITAPCAVVQRFNTKAPYWRAVCDLTGTAPSFTGSANCYS